MNLQDWLDGSVFSGLGPREALDIALTWWLLYRVMLVLRGTRAFQSLVGLGMLGVLYLASARLGLFTIRWALDSFFVYIALAVLILFQDDLRRGLARTGGSFFMGSSADSEALPVEELVQAAFSLASRRIGALVVLERQASLGDLVESGHPLDARVTQELLMTLFHPTSPLHDGAVVIRKGRVAAAKVFLPLSLSKDIARYFGTRHRAALGLTEETDAVVLVVSEERGSVSLVQAGALTLLSDTNDLRQRLQEILNPTPAPRREGLALGGR